MLPANAPASIKSQVAAVKNAYKSGSSIKASEVSKILANLRSYFKVNARKIPKEPKPNAKLVDDVLKLRKLADSVSGSESSDAVNKIIDTTTDRLNDANDSDDGTLF
jgi:hypothetical protein